MTKEEREIAIAELEGMKEKYIEGHGYETHPLPEYYAIEAAIKALNEVSLIDKIKEEIMSLDYIDEDKYEGTSIDPMVDRGEVLEILDRYAKEERTSELETSEHEIDEPDEER